MAGKPVIGWAPKPKPDPDPLTDLEEWRVRSNDGREYAPRGDGRSGVIFRQGDETVPAARARANEQAAKDDGKKQPRGKGRKPDPTPGKGKPKPSGGKAPTTAELEAVLAELLSAPAIPMAAIVGCDYCTQHFAIEGPRAAHQLVGLSETSPAFRRLLVRLHEAWTAITYGGVMLTYVGKPVLHHLAPADLLATAGPLLGVPPRPQPAPPASQNGGDTQPPPSPPVAPAPQRAPGANRPPYAAGPESPTGA